VNARRHAFEVLAAADPGRNAVFEPESARGQVVYERALAAGSGAGRPRTRVSVRVLAAVAVALALLGLGAAAYLNSRRPTHSLGVGCYAANRLDAATFVVQARARHEVDACAALWRDGTLGSPGSTGSAVPPLVACVLPSGAVGVFPGGPSTCAQLQRPVASTVAPSPPSSLGTAPPAGDVVIALRDRLVAAGRATPCLRPDDARATVRQAFADLGLSDWTMVVGPGPTGQGYDGSRPCTTFSFEQEQRRVVLVPSPSR
jgi:hypothetical protein